MRLQTPDDFTALVGEIKNNTDPNQPMVSVCSGPGCIAFKGLKVADAFDAELEKRGLSDKWRVARTGCHGFCERGPSVVILPEEIAYLKVTPEDVPELVATTDRQGLSTMDIVAVLTRIIQSQQQRIDELESRLDKID